MASEPEPVAPSAINTILEGIKQFGLAADGSDLRDLVAAAEQRGRDEERERCAKIADGFCLRGVMGPIGPLHDAGMIDAATGIAAAIRKGDANV